MKISKITFKQANTILINKIGIWYSPIQLIKFKPITRLEKLCKLIMYRRLCGKF